MSSSRGGGAAWHRETVRDGRPSGVASRGETISQVSCAVPLVVRAILGEPARRRSSSARETSVQWRGRRLDRESSRSLNMLA